MAPGYSEVAFGVKLDKNKPDQEKLVLALSISNIKNDFCLCSQPKYVSCDVWMWMAFYSRSGSNPNPRIIFYSNQFSNSCLKMAIERYGYSFT